MEKSDEIAAAPTRPSFVRRAASKILGPTVRAAIRPVSARVRTLERAQAAQKAELERQALVIEAMKKELIAVTHRLDWRDSESKRTTRV